MENVELTSKEVGRNGFWALRNEMAEFVCSNFEVIFEGAKRLNTLRLDTEVEREVHFEGSMFCQEYPYIMIANGHFYNIPVAPTEVQLRATAQAIQTLVDKGAEEIPAPFEFEIK